MRTMMLVFTAVLVLVLGAMAGPAVWAQSKALGEGGDGGPAEPCECEDEQGNILPCVDECDAPQPIGISTDQEENVCTLTPEGMPDLALCASTQMSALPGYNSLVGADDSYQVSKSDGSAVDCIGMSEAVPGIGMITLGLDAPQRVAKIFKFVEVPAGNTPGNSDAAVHITLNDDTFTVVTSLTLTTAQLNAAIATTLATKYTVDDRGDYWIVKAGRTDGYSVTSLVLRADDVGLLTSHVELRPVRLFASQYDIGCGEAGF